MLNPLGEKNPASNRSSSSCLPSPSSKVGITKIHVQHRSGHGGQHGGGQGGRHGGGQGCQHVQNQVYKA